MDATFLEGGPRGDVPPVLERIIGQKQARAVLAGSVHAPFHAYLFLGPQGSGRRQAAISFAAALVCPNGGCGNCPSCRDALSGLHPDIVTIERQGASITVGEARTIAALAQRAPRFGARQVLILVDFHLVDEAAPALLKTIEEPPPTTVFLVLADSLPKSLVTIASRCVEVGFTALDASTIEAVLLADGIAPDVASVASSVAGGRLDRARLLAGDPGFSARQDRWRAVLERLDGTGATVSLLASELIDASEELVAVLRDRQAEEIAALNAAAERAGERRSPGLKAVEARHKREQRRVRTDELRAGLATLSAAYRARLTTPTLPPNRIGGLTRSCALIDAAAHELVRNPNEVLLIQALLINLDSSR
jgi:DNA polymerase-3 subunit delta'